LHVGKRAGATFRFFSGRTVSQVIIGQRVKAPVDGFDRFDLFAQDVRGVRRGSRAGFVVGWVFQNPSGKAFDLSSIDLSKLDLLV
jgi:hypothetical protein